MRKNIRVFWLLLFVLNSIYGQISIYDIQYTTVSAGGAFPSLYNGQVVSTGGIVTATGYLGGRFFISSSTGGAWNGLFVYDDSYSPNIGDSVLISGLVYEYQGYTEIMNLNSFQIVSSANPLPAALNISTIDINNEAYEGVLVELNDCNVSSTYDSWGNWVVDDGTGSGSIRPGIFDLQEFGFPLFLNYSFEKIIGVIGINYGNKNLHPRSIYDLKSDSDDIVISTPQKLVLDTVVFQYPVLISLLNQGSQLNLYSLIIEYDNNVFNYQGFNNVNTVSENGNISDSSVSGEIILSFTGNTSFSNFDTLINLNFQAINYGEADFVFSEATINGNLNLFTYPNVLKYASMECDIPIGDTLTVIQRPVLNIPEIVTTGEEFDIICFAPAATNSWNAELIFGEVVVPIIVNQVDYDSILDKWNLNVEIQSIDFFELYDLRITASNGLIDTVRNSVKVIPEYKEKYNFIHITDTHLPGKTYYGEEGYETDFSEMLDLYEVIKDINLINPEFVLLTGDLINEGELEDFECLRNHTMSVELIEMFEVPVYIVPGNHDIGGWDATPPPQGTARKEWWRFFGWRQQNFIPAEIDYLSHDYSFDYGNIHFTGLEAYDNYDGFMSSVYGNESFTSFQMDWLQNDLATAGSMTKVLFYHYDFKNELDLLSLGVDMALWGHNHHNTGNIFDYPCSLSTASTCNDIRAYRLIRVENGSLQAENTVSSHDYTDMLSVTYSPTNDGSSESVIATIINKHDLEFDGAMLKFIMPSNNFGYDVINGEIVQIMASGSIVICYVEADIPSDGQINVTLNSRIENSILNDVFDGFSFSPCPVKDEINIEYELFDNCRVNISIFDLTGRIVSELVNKDQIPGKYHESFMIDENGNNKLVNGNYILKYWVNEKMVLSKKISIVK